MNPILKHQLIKPTFHLLSLYTVIHIRILCIGYYNSQEFFTWLFALVKFHKRLNFHVGYDLVLTQVGFPVKLLLIDLLYLSCCYPKFLIGSSQQLLQVFFYYGSSFKFLHYKTIMTAFNPFLKFTVDQVIICFSIIFYKSFQGFFTKLHTCLIGSIAIFRFFDNHFLFYILYVLCSYGSTFSCFWIYSLLLHYLQQTIYELNFT